MGVRVRAGIYSKDMYIWLGEAAGGIVERDEDEDLAGDNADFIKFSPISKHFMQGLTASAALGGWS
jgi:hypothetical protein